MFKVLKQELLFIPVMLLLIEGFRHMILAFYPETALFDRGSELESFLFHVWQITWISAATWLLLRVVTPGAYKALVRFYHTFETRDEKWKQEFGVKAFLTVFLALVLLSSRANTRSRLCDTMHAQLQVRELTGNNDGAAVERYLHYVGRSAGDSWCAAFVSYNLGAVGITKPINPVTAWSPAFANSKYQVWSPVLVKAHRAKQPRCGDVFTLYYSHLGRVGHTGFIVQERSGYFITIEGNTGLAGSREGSGVHKLKRSKAKIYRICDYITPYEQCEN